MKKIFLDKGHGGSDPGAVANGLQEKTLTHQIVEYAVDHLFENYTGFELRVSRAGDQTLTLSQRAKMANDWGADVFVSVHINAGKGTGFESYVYNGGVSSQTIALQNVLHGEILFAMRGFGAITDRGKKRANYAVLRETKMPAVLTENLFIDSNDAKYLKNEAFLKAVGEAHARGVAKFLGLPQKAKPQPQKQQKESDGKLYRVQVGAFSDRENAERLAEELKGQGYPAVIV
ncbi:sporulation-specific N-acetylmuramoyl-L-alanine amidase [Geobacillus kaustophilus]|uniref:Sporulation-specific N-acetylmuramoyl-L-alanine amidase n=1 Tax=Geobacillus kaustophilus TaxID=1462 RepID=A0A0D8C716_GEOKU|nr:N-acetylmuramoyl-L-alanine amidase [Geobacillus kaustophilus]KJE27750.1 sporulation-specific N-acetylmuramoyl-L-alanine amidase [Geobacillus kaustophilus]KJE32228.1 sporulation-specific N-acetylmuramoyl-L-alanine amidase [Geobacillus kaustophilus]